MQRLLLKLRVVFSMGVLVVILIFPWNLAVADIVQNTQNIHKHTSLAVMPFFASGGEKEAWLSKGLADMFIQNMGQLDKYAVLERSQVQDFIKELKLSSFSGESDDLLTIGKMAVVNQVVYGHYNLVGSKIELNIFLYDVAFRKVVGTLQKTGKLDDIRLLIKEIVIELSKKNNGSISESEIENIRFSYTDSLPATKRFYQGVDAYDKGEYADAMGEFLAAYQKDKTYAEALFWVGRMQEVQQLTKHALSTYEKLYRDAPDRIVSQDAILFAGKLALDDLKNNKKAKELFSQIYNRPEYTPHKLMAAYYLAEIKIEDKEKIAAYKLLKKLEDFTFGKSKRPAYQKKSAYFNWYNVNNLSQIITRKMIILYSEFDMAKSEYKNLDLPVGAFIIDVNNPIISEKYKKTKPFLYVEQKGYSESYYAVIVPKGFQASAVDLRISGKCGGCFSRGMDFSIQLHRFPLPRDHFTNWLGALYGQTSKRADLEKRVSFNGDNKSIFILKLNEGGGRIFNWTIKAKIVKTNAKAVVLSKHEKINFTGEGAIVSEVDFEQAQYDGTMKTLQESFYKGSKREIAITKDGLGVYHIVIVAGDIKSTRTDLWHSSSSDLVNWSKPEKLNISSMQKDFSPTLIAAEDGSIQLFWLSQRHGQEWSLWTSRYNQKKAIWSDAYLIPFYESKIEDEDDRKASIKMPHYSVMQTSKGQWVLAYRDEVSEVIPIIYSYDLKDWKKLNDFDLHFIRGFSLMEDAIGKWRLTGHSSKIGSSMMYVSNNGVSWKSENIKKICKGANGIKCTYLSGITNSVRVLDYSNNRLVFFSSDEPYGLKFAIFNPYGRFEKLDLVTKIKAQPYDVMRDKNSYIIAIKKGNKVILRRYNTFKTNPKSKSYGGIYNEIDYNDDGSMWERIFATQRYIQPDVTTVGVDSNTGLWWGIETGIMAILSGKTFFQDVSMGYFYHYTSRIESCSIGRAYVASDTLKQSRIAMVAAGVSFVKNMLTGERNINITLSGGMGAVIDLLCGNQKNTVYASTDKGELFFVNGTNSKNIYNYSNGKITSLAKSKKAKLIFATSDGKVFSYKNNKAQLIVDVGSFIYDVVEGKNGTLWIAAEDKGLLSYEKNIGLLSYKVAYSDIGELVADTESGVWYIANGETKSLGLGYFDGKKDYLFNPPSHMLSKPSSLKIDKNGRAVIGTWFDGLYTFTLKDRM